MRLTASFAFLSFIALLVAGSGCSSGLHGSFSCGSAKCDLATQACSEVWDGVSPNPIGISCEDLPAPCLSDHTCQCAEQQGLTDLDQCTEDSDGSLTVYSQLP
jgi:hypothetical protein